MHEPNIFDQVFNEKYERATTLYQEFLNEIRPLIPHQQEKEKEIGEMINNLNSQFLKLLEALLEGQRSESGPNAAGVN